LTGTAGGETPRLGTVSDYDAARGLGTVVEDGGERFGFHATAIADGSRRIDAGTRVAFAVRPGHRGALEARGLVPLPPT
jgi:CspA family cold shock protein